MPAEPNISEDAIFKSIGDLKKKIQLSGKGFEFYDHVKFKKKCI